MRWTGLAILRFGDLAIEARQSLGVFPPIAKSPHHQIAK
jgi:hypothetical protein